MTAAVVLTGTMLLVAATLALIRVERGPSMLDRAVGLDLFTTTIVGAIAVEAAWSRRTSTIPILVALSLVGFIGSVAVARFAAVEPAGEGRIRTPAEVAAADAARLAAELAEDAADAGRSAGAVAEEADSGRAFEPRPDAVDPGDRPDPADRGR